MNAKYRDVIYRHKKIFNCIYRQNHGVCMEMPMILCYEFAIIEDSWHSYYFHDHVGCTCKCQWWPSLFEVEVDNRWQQTLNFIASLATLSVTSYNQRFPRIIDVASVIILWFGGWITQLAEPYTYSPPLSRMGMWM